ncbi:MAG TPA: Hpt domain-containing protein, partial [Terriglobales bacterium]
AGDREQAGRLSHSLKGVAGNLGINKIFVLAGNLESAIRESRATGSLLEEFTSVMALEIPTIQAALSVATPDADKPSDTRPPQRAIVLAAVARLREHLEKSAADAPRAFADLAAILERTSVAGRLDALGTAVKAFDFDAALVKLAEISDEYASDQS